MQVLALVLLSSTRFFSRYPRRQILTLGTRIDTVTVMSHGGCCVSNQWLFQLIEAERRIYASVM